MDRMDELLEKWLWADTEDEELEAEIEMLLENLAEQKTNWKDEGF